MKVTPRHANSLSLKSSIIRSLYFEKALSCAELSLVFNKSVPVITKTINELIEEGLVTEIGFATSSGGRRPVMYALKADAMYIMAIAVDQLSTRIAIVDLNNTPVAEVELVELLLKDNPKALEQLIIYINNYLVKSGVSRKSVLGIGIGMPGFVSVTEGVNYTYLKAGGQKLTDYIFNATGLPTFIDNDSSLIALAEQRFGVAKSQPDVMVINLGWGIGLGMIVNGNIYRGHNGFAGEFSHIPLFEEGALCSCGKKGCLEAEASMLVVTQKAIEGIKNGHISTLNSFIDDPLKLMGDALFDAANKGDQFVIDLLSDAGYKIGKALSILIHIMNPQTIVLSGRGAIAGKILLAPIQQALNKYCIPRLAINTELLISTLGFDGAIIGASALVMEHFDNEQLTNNLKQSSMDKTQ
ncbi:MAG TPA: ROK family protein [Mucilaginibacter sp.]|nr:ROK family protein [Mucilaginibacter sp.]